MKKLLLLIPFLLYASPAFADQVFLTTNPGVPQTWTVPANYDASTATFECIGSGGASLAAVANTRGSAGGGGGAYAAISQLALTPGTSISYMVGASATTTPLSNANATFFGTVSSTTASLDCDGGQGGVITNLTPAGGLATKSIGTIKFNGGTGAAFSTCITVCGGGGGGGSAGPRGAGKISNPSTTSRGGTGGGGSGSNLATNGGVSGGPTGTNGGTSSIGTAGGVGGTPTADATAGSNGSGGGGGGNWTSGTGNGAAGSCEPYWDATHGPCGGGGGGSGSAGSTLNGAAGGTYGGGAGGAGDLAAIAGAGASGGTGIIVITWNVPHGKTYAPQGTITLLQGTFVLL